MYCDELQMLTNGDSLQTSILKRRPRKQSASEVFRFVGPVPGLSERYELVLLRPEADRFAMFERMDAVA